MGLVFRHPEEGDWVGDYRIVKEIGSGGFGTVFKAERDGLFFAVKVLRSGGLGARERREIGILLLLDIPGVARFRACGDWLDSKLGTPYIVTDFVPGMTLEEYAEVENPSARKSARIILDSALTLGVVHLHGVFHRDLKPENIIIQGKNERPVLIDFGVGTYVGAPVITPHGLPPGTYEFRAPEAYLFNRANLGLAHYDFTATDDLWALGVTFYWLLTNVLPFGDRSDPEGGGLVKRILQQTPVAPHVLNPRVPRALSGICMKMLEKKPEDRYASVAELCAALDGALADAELDGRWDLPLFDPDAPDTRTTDEAPAKAQPRRGRKPKKEVEPASRQDDISTAPQAPAPSEAPRATAGPRPPASRHRARLAATAMLAVAVLGVFLLIRSLLSPTLSAPPDTSSEVATTRQAEPGHEVALSVKPPDPPVGEGAEPMMGSISAPVMITMLHKDDTSEKPQEKKTKVLGRAGKALVTGFVCKTLAGCPAPQVVRPTPEPEPCPAGAVETMERLGIDLEMWNLPPATFLTPEAMYITVQEGNTTLDLIGGWGNLPDRTLLSGRLIFGDGRVYGRLTEATVPGGETFKVCLEVWDLQGGRGAIREPDGGPESARIFSTVRVRAVSSFE